MTNSVKAIPEGHHTITPGITVKDTAKAVEFYKKAFGAQELMRMPGPGGKGILHAELKIGDSLFFLSDEFPDMGSKSPQTLGSVTGSFYLYVPDVDAAFNKAVSAGATVVMPVTDMFWGDRHGVVSDPFGHKWGLATHTKDLTPEEIAKGQEAFFAQMAARQ